MVEKRNRRQWDLCVIVAVAALMMTGCKGTETADPAGKGDAGQSTNSKTSGASRPIGQGVK